MIVARLVWYDRGAPVRADTFADWVALKHGIEGVVEFEEELAPNGDHLKRMIHGTDWYVWRGGNVEAGPGGDPGAWADPPTEVCSGCLKRSGVNLPDDVWERIRLAMLEAKWPN